MNNNQSLSMKTNQTMSTKSTQPLSLSQAQELRSPIPILKVSTLEISTLNKSFIRPGPVQLGLPFPTLTEAATLLDFSLPISLLSEVYCKDFL